MENATKIKILYIATNITDSGGVSRVVSIKANHFAETLGYEVHIYSTNDKDKKAFYEFSDKIYFHFSNQKHFNIKNIFNYRKEIKEISHRIKPSMTFVVDNGFKSLLISDILYPFGKKIYELHSSSVQLLNHTYSGVKKRLFKALIPIRLNSFDKIILLKESYKMNFLPPHKQSCIPNPLPFLPNEKSTRNHKRAIAVGRIAQVKGYERMLLVWKKVMETHPEYTLDIYGDEMENYSLSPLIHQLGLTQSVNVYPATRNIMKHYLQADFLLHAAYLEPFGMVYIEAMACGLPVVCFSTEADDIVINQYNGLVANTEKKYFNNIISIIENKELSDYLAKNAIEFAKRYDIKEIQKKSSLI